MNQMTPSLKKSGFARAFLRGEISYGFWGIVGTVVGLGNTFLTITSLTIYQYGVFQLLLSSYAFLAVLIGLGGETIRNDLLRFVSTGREAEAKKLFHENGIFRMVIGVLLWAFVFFNADFLSFRFGPEFIFHIKLISFLFLHDAMLFALRLSLDARKRFHEIASRASIAKIVQLGMLSYFFFFQVLGLKELLMSLVTSYFVALGFLIVPFIRSYAPWRYVHAVSGGFLYDALKSYGKWELVLPAATKFSNVAQTWLTKLFIGTEAVAIFSIAQTVVGTLAGTFPVKTLSTLVPLEIADKAKIQRIFNQGLKYLLVYSLAISSVAALSVPFLIQWLFPNYVVSLPYFFILLLTVPLSAFSVMASIFLVVFRRQKFLFFQKIFKMLIGIPLYIVLLPLLGLWGLAIHGILLSIALNVIVYWQLHHGGAESVRVEKRALVRFDRNDWDFAKRMWRISSTFVLGAVSRIKPSL